MTTLQRRSALPDRLIWLNVALATAAAICYVLIGMHILAVGDLQAAERPAPIIYIAASCYLLGGMLILLRRRWLWIIGAVVNVLVMLMFLSAYLDRPAVLFSAGGLASKTAQLLLELGLIVLIITNQGRNRAGNSPGNHL